MKKELIELVKAAQNGEEGALNELFNAYYNDIYYFALKTVKDENLAYDITQETFIEIINTIGNLKEPAAFVAWSRTITYHQCTRYFKRKQAILVDEDEDGATIFDNLKEENAEFIPDEALDNDEFKKTILNILDELSEEQRSATILYYFDELSIKQIAEIQKVSEGTVKSRLNYARKAIKSSVETYEKKHGIKLHTIALLPLIKWVFEGVFSNGISAEAASGIASGVSASTGVSLSAAASTYGSAGATVAGASVAAESSATVVGATVNATKTVGLFSKIASIPLTTKIVAGVITGAILIGGSVAMVTLLSGNDNHDKKPDSSISTPISTTVETEKTEPEHEHSYSSKVTKKATCTAEGQKIFTCSCGDTYSEKLDIRDHQWAYDNTWYVEVPSIIGREEGVQKRTCESCGKIDRRNYTEDVIDNSFEDHALDYLLDFGEPSGDGMNVGGLLGYAGATYPRSENPFSCTSTELFNHLSKHFVLTDSLKEMMKQSDRYDETTDTFNNLGYEGVLGSVSAYGYVHKGGNKYEVYYLYSSYSYYKKTTYWKVELEYNRPEDKENRYISVVQTYAFPDDIINDMWY